TTPVEDTVAEHELKSFRLALHSAVEIEHVLENRQRAAGKALVLGPHVPALAPFLQCLDALRVVAESLDHRLAVGIERIACLTDLDRRFGVTGVGDTDPFLEDGGYPRAISDVRPPNAQNEIVARVVVRAALADSASAD